MKKIITAFIFISLTTVLLSAGGQKDQGPIKIAFLPVLDSLPFYIAESEGYFRDEGVSVEAVPVSSPVERDQLMQAGGVQGMLNELSSTALFNRDGVKVQTVQIARMATEKSPVFRILASPKSGITKPSDLAGQPIGVSMNSVIEYMTDRILQAEGLKDNQIVVKSVPVIPERFQLLMSGQIPAATLPDPLAQAAIGAGAVEVISDTAYPAYSMSVLSFSKDTVDKRKADLKKFLKAWNHAVADLNGDPDKYRALFLEKIPVPPAVKATFVIPPFAAPQLPGEKDWNDVIDWLTAKGLLQTRPSYGDSVKGL